MGSTRNGYAPFDIFYTFVDPSYGENPPTTPKDDFTTESEGSTWTTDNGGTDLWKENLPLPEDPSRIFAFDGDTYLCSESPFSSIINVT
jgi:hypothetical protein